MTLAIPLPNPIALLAHIKKNVVGNANNIDGTIFKHHLIKNFNIFNNLCLNK